MHSEDPGIAIAFLYCNYKRQLEQTVSNLVTSLLKQLVQDHSTAFNDVKDWYKGHNDRSTQPTTEEVLTVLGAVAEKFSKVFIVVDALDECSEIDGTRAKLLAALRSMPSTVKLLITSRDLPSIAAEFREANRIDINANDEDLQKYIEGRIPREPRLATHVRGCPSLRDEIVKKIIENARGM